MVFGAATVEETLNELKNHPENFVLDDDYYGLIEDYEYYVKNGKFRNLDVRATKGRKNILFGESQSKKTIYENYGSFLGPVKDQTVYGTCYMEAAATVAEFYIWMHTGKQYLFTRNEIWDCAADSKGIKRGSRSNKHDAVDGGHADKALRAIYEFNSEEQQKKHYWTSGKSEICEVFKNLIDKNIGGGGDHFIKTHRFNLAEIPKRLQQYGLLTYSFYSRGPYDGPHAVTIYAGDGTKMCIRNSWGGDSAKKDWVMNQEFINERGAWGHFSIENPRHGF